MRSKTLTLASLLLLLALVVPAAALFGPPTATYRGRVTYMQPTNFMLMGDRGESIRIMVPRDRKVPPEVQLGVLVEVETVQGNDKQWYLDKFRRIQLQPNQ